MQFEVKQCVKLILHLSQINKRPCDIWKKKQKKRMNERHVSDRHVMNEVDLDS